MPSPTTLPTPNVANVTRDQLEVVFGKDARLLRQFELLFRNNVMFPDILSQVTTIIDEAMQAAITASAAGASNEAQIVQLMAEVSRLASVPAVETAAMIPQLSRNYSFTYLHMGA